MAGALTLMVAGILAGTLGQTVAPLQRPTLRPVIVMADLAFFPEESALAEIPPLVLPSQPQGSAILAPMVVPMPAAARIDRVELQRPMPTVGPPLVKASEVAHTFAPPKANNRAAGPPMTHVASQAVYNDNRRGSGELTDRIIKAVSVVNLERPAATDQKVVQGARPPSLLPVEQIPSDDAGRKRMARTLLAESRALMARGDYAGAQTTCLRAMELAVDYGRFEDNPKALLSDITRASIRQGR